MTAPSHRPAPLLVAAAMAGVEALLLIGYGVVELTVISSDKVAMGVTTAAFFVVYGAGLAFCTWTMAGLQSWARSPVVMAQLIQLGVAWSFWGGSSKPIAVGLAVMALVVLAGIFHPASLAALSEHAGQSRHPEHPEGPPEA